MLDQLSGLQEKVNEDVTFSIWRFQLITPYVCMTYNPVWWLFRNRCCWRLIEPWGRRYWMTLVIDIFFFFTQMNNSNNITLFFSWPTKRFWMNHVKYAGLYAEFIQNWPRSILFHWILFHIFQLEETSAEILLRSSWEARGRNDSYNGQEAHSQGFVSECNNPSQIG